MTEKNTAKPNRRSALNSILSAVLHPATGTACSRQAHLTLRTAPLVAVDLLPRPVWMQCGALEVMNRNHWLESTAFHSITSKIERAQNAPLASTYRVTFARAIVQAQRVC